MSMTNAVHNGKATKPKKFQADTFEQFQKTVAAGFSPITLHHPFATRTDKRIGKVREMGKAPVDANWPRMHYDSKTVIADCYANFQNMGYRIADGVGGLDVDERSGGLKSLKKLCKRFPSFDPSKYPRAISGGGTGAGGHLLFRIPKGVKLKKSLADDGFPGLEPVCVGRQLVSPGSLHPTTGRMYEWDETHPDVEEGLPELPPNVLAFLTRPKRHRTEHPSAGILTNEQVARMLSGLDPEDFRDYESWLTIGMAVHYATDGMGDDVWRNWSAADEEFFNDEELDLKWQSFGIGHEDPVTHLHLFKLLSMAGKRNLIPVLAGSVDDDFSDDPDMPNGEGDPDAWLNGDSSSLDGILRRAKTNPAAPFEESALTALAQLTPEELHTWLQKLRGIGFKQLTALSMEVRRARPKKSAKKAAETPMSLLQRIVGTEADLSMQSDGSVFAQVTTDGVVKCMSVASKEFDEWLAYRLYSLRGMTASDPVLRDLKRVLIASCKHEGAPVIPSFRRIAPISNAVYIDLCNDARQFVKITANGWEVNSSSQLPKSFRFTRSAGMQPLPIPADLQEGDLSILRSILTIKADGNVPSIEDSGFVLAVCWLLSCFTNGPYPILTIDGGAGTAKSTTCDLIRSVIDPSFAPSRSMPSSELDLFVAAQSAYVQLYDNLSRIPPWFSDALCRLATGGGLSKRELFTDAEEFLMKARNPIMLNGLHSDMLRRNDLLDRALMVSLRKITTKKTEAMVKREFNDALPVVLSGLFNMVAHGLRKLPLVAETGAATRLADFERWLTACEPYLWRQGTFQRVFMGMRAVAKSKLLMRSPVARTLIEFMADKESWTGTAKSLNAALEKLHDFEDDGPTSDERWPGGLHIFGRRLRDATGMLQEVYKLDVDFREADDRDIAIRNGRLLDFG
ncbi:PriCT-2 domain-containing protein [Bradyrhizobium sp. 38]|nr:PriCT-2 domain-containing protein [Bradyrhizobium sp. 38]MCK1775712.1 PriCT-2 domain-containing protein [Bradyrhizobium sp. 132]